MFRGGVELRLRGVLRDGAIVIKASGFVKRQS